MRPLKVPKARILVEFTLVHIKLVMHMLELGIFDLVDFVNIFAVEGAPVLDGLIAVGRK